MNLMRLKGREDLEARGQSNATWIGKEQWDKPKSSAYGMTTTSISLRIVTYKCNV